MTVRWRSAFAALLLLFGIASAIVVEHGDAQAAPATSVAVGADLAADAADALADAELLRSETSDLPLPRPPVPVPAQLRAAAPDRGDPPYRPPARSR